MANVKKDALSPLMHDDQTDRIVGVKNSDASEKLFVYTDGSQGPVRITDTTASTSTTTGALVVSGGVGVAGAINVGGTANVAGIATVSNTTASSSTTTGALVVSGGVGVAGAVRTGADCFVQGIRVGIGAFANTSNTAIGTSALNANSSGVANTAIGSNALSAAQSANSNTAVGANALATATGGSNTAIGRDALSAATGSSNTAVGSQAMAQITSGGENTAIGWAALYPNQGGVRNVAVGIDAGRYFGASPSTDAITTANDSVFIGATARANGNSQNNQVVIAGRNGVGNGSNTTTLGNSSTVGTYIAGTATSMFAIAGDTMRIVGTRTPASNAAGTAGDFAFGTDGATTYLYYCIASGNWGRVAFTTGY